MMPSRMNGCWAREEKDRVRQKGRRHSTGEKEGIDKQRECGEQAANNKLSGQSLRGLIR